MRTAGKTVLEHILDDILTLNPDEIIFIVGYLGDKIKEFAAKTYSNIKTTFITQKEYNGLGAAINLSRERVQNNENLLIILGDTLIRTNLHKFIKKGNNVIAVKNVLDPRKFGVIETNGEQIKKFVEKPELPPSNLAVVGLYFIENAGKLYKALDNIMQNNIKTKNEYQLTDALELMLQNGEIFNYFNIDKWLDCGNKENLLETNKELLIEQGSIINGKIESSVIIDPVFVHKNAVIKNSVIGPYVSISEGTTISGCIVKNSIICEDSEIENIALSSSLISDNAYVSDKFRQINIGSHAEIDLSAKYQQ
jgi:glucose-1-phosphate thymidylyltransferase